LRSLIVDLLQYAARSVTKEEGAQFCIEIPQTSMVGL